MWRSGAALVWLLIGVLAGMVLLAVAFPPRVL